MEGIYFRAGRMLLTAFNAVFDTHRGARSAWAARDFGKLRRYCPKIMQNVLWLGTFDYRLHPRCFYNLAMLFPPRGGRSIDHRRNVLLHVGEAAKNVATLARKNEQ